MILKTLNLTNFRNYQNFKIDFDKITIFIGPNGIGKTNLIEALYMLSIGKSFRTNYDNEIIMWGEDFCRINGVFKDCKIEVFISISPNKIKLAKVNDIKKKITDLIGKMQITIFSPESMEILTGSPKSRRKFLDLILSQTSHEYLVNLIELNKVIKNRNYLLYNVKIGKNKPDELYFWNKKLIELSKLIITKRIELIEYINSVINKSYKEISKEQKEIKLKYITNINNIDKFEDELLKNQEKEIYKATTLYGPHRDDIEFIINSKNVASFASRGELRSIIFALKMSELEFYKTIGNKPLLLLDDIFSELDESRREKLAEIILTEPTVITTTDKNFLSKKLIEESKIIELK